MKHIVKGYVATWQIKEENGEYWVSVGNDKPLKSYSSLERAKKAIRIAEMRYVKDHQDTPVANRGIWCDHGVLWTADFDGNYYN